MWVCVGVCARAVCLHVHVRRCCCCFSGWSTVAPEVPCSLAPLRTDQAADPAGHQTSDLHVARQQGLWTDPLTGYTSGPATLVLSRGLCCALPEDHNYPQLSRRIISDLDADLSIWSDMDPEGGGGGAGALCHSTSRAVKAVYTVHADIPAEEQTRALLIPKR